jgi:hypothetical protein
MATRAIAQHHPAMVAAKRGVIVRQLSAITTRWQGRPIDSTTTTTSKKRTKFFADVNPKLRYMSSVFSPFSEHSPNTVAAAVSLENATLAQKEEWLDSLLVKFTQTNGDMRIPASSETSSSSPPLTVDALLVVLEALAEPAAVRNDPSDPRRAELWMNRLLNVYAASNYHPALQPTVECYQHIIQCWANSDKENPMVIVNRSERWLKEMLEQCSEEDADVLLPIVTLSNREYSEHLRQQQQDAGYLDENEKDRRPQFHSHPNHRPLVPTIECINAFLDGCTRGRPGKNKKSQLMVTNNAKKAEAILRRLVSYQHHYGEKATVRFNTETCNFVIRGWTRCKHDETIHWRVLSVLRIMESYQRNDPLHAPVKPNTKSYSMAMNALIAVSRIKAQSYYTNLKQTKYNRSHNGNNQPKENPFRNGMEELEQAQAILKYMHQLFDAGVEGVVPHRVPYNIMITGWAGRAAVIVHDDSSNGPPFQAEEILRTMLSHRDNGFFDAAPDVVSYEKVMLAWANSDHPDAGTRAKWWLKQLWKEHDRQKQEASSFFSREEEINLLPTVNTYNIVMKALARSDGALAAENLLLDLGERYQQEHTPELCPNSESFAIAIRAWLQSADQTRNIDDRISSLKRAVEWLSSLREIENEKNLSTAPELYHGVIRTARSAASPDRPFVLDIAKSVFDKFRQSRHRVNYLSYAALLQVGLKVFSRPEHSEERGEFLNHLFHESCEDGLLSNLFVRALSNNDSPECQKMVEDLYQQWPLPASWTRNLKNYLTHPEITDFSASLRNAQESAKRRNRRSSH